MHDRFQISEEQRLQLSALVQAMRSLAVPVGPLHGLWDWIADSETFLQGKPGILEYTAADYLREGYAALRRCEKMREPGVSRSKE